MSTKADKIKHLLALNVVDVIERAHLEKALRTGKKLRVKLGIDPTSPDLHLGHAVVLRKLKEFQDLGHSIVFIIGDFTARIGDPSGRSKTRPPLIGKEVKANEKDYLRQAAKVVNVKRAEVRHNSEWLTKLKGEEILKLLGLVSVQQIIERNDFAKRLAAHQSIGMHELLYPIMQAYDSVVINADVECGGTDQLFNLLVGRVLMERLGMKPQDVLTTPLLEGTGGKEKMSKSYGNYVALDDKPDDMFGKIMSIPDALTASYFELCTELPRKEIAKLNLTLSPRDKKARLGHEVVKLYYGERVARKAEENFRKKFSEKEPEKADIPWAEIKRRASETDLLNVVLSVGITKKILKSKQEAWRLIQQGGVEYEGDKLTNPREKIKVRRGAILKLGKKSFFRLKY